MKKPRTLEARKAVARAILDGVRFSRYVEIRERMAAIWEVCLDRAPMPAAPARRESVRRESVLFNQLCALEEIEQEFRVA